MSCKSMTTSSRTMSAVDLVWKKKCYNVYWTRLIRHVSTSQLYSAKCVLNVRVQIIFSQFFNLIDAKGSTSPVIFARNIRIAWIFIESSYFFASYVIRFKPKFYYVIIEFWIWNDAEYVYGRYLIYFYS